MWKSNITGGLIALTVMFATPFAVDFSLSLLNKKSDTLNVAGAFGLLFNFSAPVCVTYAISKDFYSQKQ